MDFLWGCLGVYFGHLWVSEGMGAHLGGRWGFSGLAFSGHSSPLLLAMAQAWGCLGWRTSGQPWSHFVQLGLFGVTILAIWMLIAAILYSCHGTQHTWGAPSL